MEHLELIVFGLLVAVALLGMVAKRTGIPYPILFVLGGCAIAPLPGADEMALDPDLVLLLFLPPLLYYAAFENNPRALRANARPIALLAIGLVAATTLVTAVAAHELIGLSWPVAFVLGAIVSPTDVVAPAQIVRRLGVPRRLVTIVEGENLMNDWTALSVYGFAVAAVVTGTFSLGEASLRFVANGLGGLAIGLVAGYLLRILRRNLDHPPTEITVSLFCGFAAYIPAEEVGVSGVIAAVTVGLYMGWYTSELTTATTRLQITSVWETVDFLLNAVLFVLVGVQLGAILDGTSGHSTGELIGDGALLAVVVVATRVFWIFPFTYVPRLLSRRVREREPAPDWRNIAVLAWCGQRGAVAIAAALALPLTIDAGAPFPERDLVIFVTYVVMIVTLVGQGLTLPMLIRALGVQDDGGAEREELLARKEMAEAAIARVDELAWEPWVHQDTAERQRGLHEYRRRRHAARIDGAPLEESEQRSARFARLTNELIDAQRQALIALRDSGAITDEVKRRLERELDLEEARFA